MGILSLIGLALVTMGSDSLSIVRSQSLSNSAEAAAEAGAWQTVTDIVGGTVGATTMGHYTDEAMPSGQASFSVDVYAGGDLPPGWADPLPPDHFYISAVGKAEEKSPRRVAIVLELTSSLFQGAIFAADKIDFKQDSYTDTWDSGVGPYAASLVDGAAQAHIGTNSTDSDSIKMASGVFIDKDSTTGTSTGNVLAAPGAPPDVVKNGTSPTNYAALQYLVQPRPLPPVDLEGNDTTTADDVSSGPPGAQFDAEGYLLPGVYKDVVVDGYELKLRGGSNYYMQSLTVKKGGGLLSLEPTAAAPTTVKVQETVKIEEDTVVNTTGIPGLLNMQSASKKKIYGLDVVGKKAGADAYFTFYAPEAKVKIDGDVYGSVVGHEIQLKDAAAVHYDRALGNTASPGAQTANIYSVQRF